MEEDEVEKEELEKATLAGEARRGEAALPTTDRTLIMELGPTLSNKLSSKGLGRKSS